MMSDKRATDTTDLDAQLDEILVRVFQRGINEELPDYYKVTLSVPDAKQALIKLIEDREHAIDRLEVIDEGGRAYARGATYGYPVSVKLSYQDGGRTLKVFVALRKEGDK